MNDISDKIVAVQPVIICPKPDGEEYGGGIHHLLAGMDIRYFIRPGHTRVHYRKHDNFNNLPSAQDGQSIANEIVQRRYGSIHHARQSIMRIAETYASAMTKNESHR